MVTISEDSVRIKSEETVKIKKSTLKIAAFVLLALVVGYFIGNFTATGQVTANNPSNNPAAGNNPTTTLQGQTPTTTVRSPTTTTTPKVVQVSADDDPVKGDANAPVEIIEFSDFQCPFCSRWYSDALPQIQKEYIDTGKVKLVYRDFPLSSIHPQATPAAEAAECAKEQGKFWEFHDKLFENQASLSTASYKQWAQELGLNTQQFNDCVDKKKYQSEVTKDYQDGQAAGVTGTPSFFVNGINIRGAQPFSAFKTIIDQELAK